MPRYVLIDTELEEVAGDSKLFFAAFLRVTARARGAEPDYAAVERLTPAEAAEVLDLIYGDDIGWNYVAHAGAPPLNTAGYEVYELPQDLPLISVTSDRAVVARLRAGFPLVATVEKRHVNQTPFPGSRVLIFPIHSEFRPPQAA